MSILNLKLLLFVLFKFLLQISMNLLLLLILLYFFLNKTLNYIIFKSVNKKRF